MTDRHLFLMGGGPPFGEEFGEKFASLANNSYGKVAILFLPNESWERYMPGYTNLLEKHGVQNFFYFPLSTQPEQHLLDQLKQCTGIIIGGGDTERYQQSIVGTEIGNCVKDMYKDGIPVAGFSAGALVSTEHCVISPDDTTSSSNQLFLDGLGLLDDCVVSVHYKQWNEEANLKNDLAHTEASVGYGINEDSGIYLVNGILVDNEGDHVTILNEETSL